MLRGGIIESKGGAGVDYYLFRDHLKLSLDAYDFTSENNVHLRFGADVRFLKHFFVTGGIDDFAHARGDYDFFVGAGIVISDDDIGSILGWVPVSRF